MRRILFALACVVLGGVAFGLPIFAGYPLRHLCGDSAVTPFVEVVAFVVAPALALLGMFEWLDRSSFRAIGSSGCAWLFVGGVWSLGWLGHATGCGQVDQAIRILWLATLEDPLQLPLLLVGQFIWNELYPGTLLAVLAVTIGLPLLARRRRLRTDAAAGDALSSEGGV